MSVPSTQVGQGQGVPVEFRVKHGVLQIGDFVAASAASAGTLLTFDSGVPGTWSIASGNGYIAGIQGEDTFDPSSVPASVANQLWAIGILNIKKIGEPVTCWKMGRFFVTNVSGTVAFGDFLSATTGGAFISTTSTNSVTNGTMSCLVGNNSVAAGPIEVWINLG